MMRYGKLTLLLFLAALAANASAQMQKCTDRDGKISYSSEPCPPGAKSAKVEDSVSVIDASEARAMVARAKEESGKMVSRLDGMVSDSPTTGLAASDMADSSSAKLKQAKSLIQTALAGRTYMGLTAVILLVVGALIVLFTRRRKAPEFNIHYEIANALKKTDDHPDK